MASDTWQNWAGTQSAAPRRFATPTNTRELSSLVAEAASRGQRVKAVGAGHSFTGVAVTDGVLVSLDNLSGIDSITPTDDGALVTVFAGTRLHALNDALWQRGYAMANLGDIDVQSLAGATSTGTHGTGARFGGIATQIRGIEIVLADGSVVSASADENVELFEAGRLGLGAIGIISKISLACVPRFTLRAIEEPDTLSHILDTLEGDRLGLDHFEFLLVPAHRSCPDEEQYATPRRYRTRSGGQGPRVRRRRTPLEHTLRRCQPRCHPGTGRDPENQQRVVPIARRPRVHRSQLPGIRVFGAA